MSAEYHDARAFWLLALLAVAIIGVSFQGTRGLYESTEGRYAETARETMTSGDLSEPLLNGRNHWTKPPLTYWAIMAGIEGFGHNAWGVRAYLVLSWLLLVAGSGWAAHALWGHRAGGLAALVAATSPYLAAAANVVSTDLLMAGWVAMGLAGFFHALRHRRSWSWFLAGGCLGLAFLTKGPVALLVPGLVMGNTWLNLRRSSVWRPTAWTRAGSLVLFLLIGLSWYVIEASEHPGLLAYWLGKELAARFGSDEFHRNPGFFFALTTYFPIMLFGSGIWLPLAWWKRRSNPAGEEPCDVVSCAAHRALWFGLAGGLFVFCISKSKLPLYLVPLFIPLSLLLGQLLEQLVSAGRISPKSLQRVAAGMTVVLLLFKFASTLPDKAKDMEHLSTGVRAALAERLAGTEIFSVGNRSLNGLEFYLQTSVTPIPLEQAVEKLREPSGTAAPAVYLISRGAYERAAGSLDGWAKAKPVNPYWMLLERRDGGEDPAPVAGRGFVPPVDG